MTLYWVSYLIISKRVWQNENIPLFDSHRSARQVHIPIIITPINDYSKWNFLPSKAILCAKVHFNSDRTFSISIMSSARLVITPFWFILNLSHLSMDTKSIPTTYERQVRIPIILFVTCSFIQSLGFMLRNTSLRSDVGARKFTEKICSA